MAFPSIKINIGADTSRLGRDLKKGEGLVHSFGRTAGTAMAGVAAAATGAAIAIGVNGVRAAIEDEAAQVKLAKTLENVTDASKEQVKQVEAYIEKTTMATGVTDDELRPSLDRLIRSTQNVTKAQQLQQIALDVSAGTGKDLQSVTNAIAKAYDGNFGALKRLGVPLDDAIVKSKDFNKVQEALAQTFSGQLDASLDTQAGKLKLLNTRFGEMQEQLGVVLLEGIQPLMDWALSPEGQDALNSGMETLKSIVKTIAEELPKVIESFKTLGKIVSGTFDFSKDDFSTEMLAAGAAFVAMPGTPQVRGIAAVAAYMAAKGLVGLGNRRVSVAAPTTDAAFAAAQGSEGAMEYVTSGGQYASGNLGAYTGTSGLTTRRATSYRGVNIPNVTVVVNGVTDPAQAAKNVSRALNKAQRMGVNTLVYGTGT